MITFIYDQAGPEATWRLQKVFHGDEASGTLLEQTDYDPIYCPAIVANVDGDTVLPRFDGLDRLTRIDDSSGSFFEEIWDCCFIGETRPGRVQNGTDRVLERTRYSHNRRGQPIRSIDTAGRITRIDYDDAGLPTTLTDPLGRVTT